MAGSCRDLWTPNCSMAADRRRLSVRPGVAAACLYKTGRKVPTVSSGSCRASTRRRQRRTMSILSELLSDSANIVSVAARRGLESGILRVSVWALVS